MRFPFQDRKTAQAAAYLIKLGGGRLNYMVLIKLLYLADREMLLKQGAPITGDETFSMKHGPVLSSVLDFITEGEAAGHASAWFEYVTAPAGYDVGLVSTDPETDELSKYERKLLDSIFNRFGRMDKWDLVDLLHRTLPEWTDPGGSRIQIWPEAILRAESRSEEEIRSINDDAKELWFLDSLDP